MIHRFTLPPKKGEIFYEISHTLGIAITCITYLPDCHIHGVSNIYISSVINCKPFRVVHSCFSGFPIYMSGVTFRRSSNQLWSAVCSKISLDKYDREGGKWTTNNFYDITHTESDNSSTK